MSESDEKRERIRTRIEASQARLQRESAELPALPRSAPLADAYPPEDLRGLAREHPWLTVAAGIGAGMLIGALLPKRLGSKLGGRALGLATIGAELAMTLSRDTRDAASESVREGLSRIDEGTAPVRRRAARIAGDTGRGARSTGVRIAGEAIKLAARLRK